MIERGDMLFGRRARDGAEDLVDEQRVARVVLEAHVSAASTLRSTSVRRRRARQRDDAEQRPAP